MANASKPTVVLVHGAFADASGWSAVYGELTARGHPVYAPANPLPGSWVGRYLLSEQDPACNARLSSTAARGSASD
jgi:pimeloyl-ACP methyl ester carboxylesterase